MDAVLVGFLASLPRYDQFAAVQETSCIAHDTATISRILSQYPGILRRYPRYQGGIPAVLCPSDPVALATSHTTYCCYLLRRSRRAAD
jgi:hypothetical protein